MELRLEISRERPPRGVVAVLRSFADVTADHPEAVRFVGWLELLRALGDLLADETGELNPGAEGQLGKDVRDVSLDRAP